MVTDDVLLDPVAVPATSPAKPPAKLKSEALDEPAVLTGPVELLFETSPCGPMYPANPPAKIDIGPDAVWVTAPVAKELVTSEP